LRVNTLTATKINLITNGISFGSLRIKVEAQTVVKTQFVPRSEHFISVIKTDQFVLYRPKVAVYSEIYTKHTNTMWQNVKFLNVTMFGASLKQ
jgi:hypothetical protein